MKLDTTWEKAWLRKIDALELLGDVVRAYDAALDACKCLNVNGRSNVEDRRARLAARPETQGFLRDDRPKEASCCSCGILRSSAATELVKCKDCMMVSYWMS